MNKNIRKHFTAQLTACAALCFIPGLSAADAAYPTLDLDLSSTLLVMGRNYGEGVSGSSASASLSIAAHSEISEQLTAGMKSVLVENIFEDGKENAAYWLSNDTSSSLSEAFLSYRFLETPFDDLQVTLGRKELSYPFLPAYKVRHQAQSLEGIFANARINESLSLDFGHIERYSPWPSRQDGASSLDTSFRKLGERVGQSSIRSGTQFVSTKLNSNRITLNAYDYYASELYNNLGLKVSYSLPARTGDGQWFLSAHAINQDGTNGGVLDAHSANALELNLRYKLNAFSFDTGWTRIANSSSLLVPFRTTFVNDATLLWYTNQFEAGTQTYHAKAVYSRNPWTLAAVFVHASHLDLRTESELDLVAKRSLNENLSLCLKAGYGKCVFDEENRHHKSATDLRLFVDYKL